jgi:trans-aconitate methyltransferase
MLCFFAREHGYACSGVDFSPRLEEFSQACARDKVSIECVFADFRRWEPATCFDLVYSCGFVEHFQDYPAVIERHWQCVAPGGLLVLTVPLLTPYQRVVRHLVYTPDKWREVLNSHVLEIMSLQRLREVCGQLPNACELVAEHVGGFHVWIRPGDPGVRRYTLPLFLGMRAIERVGNLVGTSSKWYSTEAVVAVKKPA